MTDIFIDTSGWAELVDPKLPYHPLAAKIYYQTRQRKAKIVTTNYVIAEVVALLTSPLRFPRPRIIQFVEGLKTSPLVKIVYIDATLDDQAWQLLTRRADKNWSLVDCASFVVMRHYNLTEALTTDHHFEQAGLIRLLK